MSKGAMLSKRLLDARELRRSLGLGAASGVLTVAATPGALWPLAFACLVPLSIHWRQAKCWGAVAVSAASWGIVGWGIALAWLPSALGNHLHTSGTTSCLVTMVAVAWQTAPALLGASFYWLGRGRAADPWLFAASWLVGNAVAVVPFPYSPAAALTGCPLLLSPVWFGGRTCLEVFLLISNAWLGLAVLRGEGKSRLVSLAAIWASLWVTLSLFHHAQAPIAAEVHNLLLVQADVDDAFPRSATERIRRHVAATDRALSERADLIVWGETVISEPLGAVRAIAPPALEGPLLRWHVPLLVGAVTRPILAGPKSDSLLWNSAVLFPADSMQACEACRTDKQILVPLAEAADGLAESMGAPQIPRFTAGPSRAPIGAAGMRAGVLICYEAAFWSRVADQVVADSDVLINIVSDDWIGSRMAREMHGAQAALAAVEAGRTLVRLVSGGPSVVVLPDGTSIRVIDEGGARAAVVAVPIQRNETPYRWLVRRLHALTL